MSGSVGVAASVPDSLPRSSQRAAMDVNFAAAVMAMTVLSAVAVPGSAQPAIPECASKLISCAPYISTKETPPQTCCGPLKEAAAKELPCMCSLFNNTSLLKTFMINATKALEMGKRCGVSIDQSACNKTTSLSPSSSPTPSSSTNITGSSADGHGNSAYEVNSIGLPGLVSLLFSFLALTG